MYRYNWLPLNVLWWTWPQWKAAVLNGGLQRIGIDWQQVESALRLKGVKRKEWAALFDALRIAQDEVLEYLNDD